MKNVMVRAWEIATLSAKAFGGKKREYLSGALRQAWKETKTQTLSWVTPKGAKMEITVGVKNGSTKVLTIKANGKAGVVKNLEGFERPLLTFAFEGREAGAYLPKEITDRMFVKEKFTASIQSVIAQRETIQYKIREWDYVPTATERKPVWARA